jgi:sulfur-carrier protein adenylyltransferase/sulfurtransferase
MESQQYYTSHSKLSFIGADGQQKINGAAVLVIGVGGIGCPALQLLAGAGIGKLGIVDFDVVSESNLHRQILFSFNDIGKTKTTVAAEKINAQNPNIEVAVFTILLQENNIIDIITQFDIIVDATDNFVTRYLVNDACVMLNKPLVYGAIHQTEGHVTVFNYNGSGNLREHHNSEAIPSCAAIGAYNIITSTIGNFMANEVIKIIVADKNVLCNEVVHFNTLPYSFKSLKYKTANDNIHLAKERFKYIEYPLEILPEEFLKRFTTLQNVQLIDVRICFIKSPILIKTNPLFFTVQRVYVALPPPNTTEPMVI